MKKASCVVMLCFLALFASCAKKTITNKEMINEKDLIHEKEFSECQNLLLELHNKQRRSKNLNELNLDKNLCEYAQKHAKKMADRKYLYHSSMNYLMEANESSTIVGENIAWAQEDEVSVVDAWMNSSGHRSNILGKKFKKVGFASEKDSKGNNYWCAVFSD